MKQRFSTRTRLVSALLTLAMVFTFLPFSAFAANTEIDFNSPDFKLNFPDEEFRRFLKECCDKNGDGKLDVDIKNMTIPTSYAIKSLEGIRFFEDLETPNSSLKPVCPSMRKISPTLTLESTSRAT